MLSYVAIRYMLVSPDGVAPSRIVGVSASVNLPLHHKVQKFSSVTGSPGWSRKRAVKWLWWWYDMLSRHVYTFQLPREMRWGHQFKN